MSTTEIFVNAPANGEGDPFQELVGEGKRFATPADLAKAKKESDAYIAKLHAKIKTLENPSPDEAPSPTVNEEAPDPIESKVLEIMQTAEARRRLQSNVELVKETLLNAFGSADAVNQHLAQKASELGTTIEELQAQAQKNPALFFKAIDLKQEAIPNPTGVSVRLNTLPFVGNKVDTTPGTKGFYETKVKEYAAKGQFLPAQLQIELVNNATKAARKGDYWYEL